MTLYAAAPLLMWVVARLFPLRPRPEFSHYSADELRRKYRRLNYIDAAAFLVLGPACVYGVHEGLVRYVASRARGLEGSVHAVLPDSGFWYVPAGVLGVIVACLLIDGLNRLLLRERAAEYRHSSNATVGFNATRMFVAAGVLMAVGALTLAFFAARSRLQLTEDEIVVQRLWSLQEERYRYSRVKALTEVVDAVKKKTDFVIELDGAPDWTTAVEIVFPDPDAKRFLADRTGKVIRTLDVP